ncbi:MAG: T9SS type A sorting domain-containing protein [Ignavibacteria bacterium]|nr:T9SS type A sorting domain-containing protein [Ignavibacteria bacterium]
MKTLKFLILIFIVFLLNIGNIFSQQDTTAYRYFPLETGNYYVYEYREFGALIALRWVRIGDTVRVNDKKYYQFSGNVPDFSGSFRFDTTLGKIFKYGQSDCNNEISVDSLWANVNNTRYHCNLATNEICLSSNVPVTILNYTTTRKSFGYSHPQGGFGRQYAKNIGLYQIYRSYVSYENKYHTLVGCFVNGILYGDTNLTGFNQISSIIPEQFYLSQNYPNPFNPKTKIKFAVPSNVKGQTSNVKLIIYDLLGREVTTLVDEELKPGTYETDWDGSGYSSGVYFYKIISEGFVETKKMVLMK